MAQWQLKHDNYRQLVRCARACVAWLGASLASPNIVVPRTASDHLCEQSKAKRHVRATSRSRCRHPTGSIFSGQSPLPAGGIESKEKGRCNVSPSLLKYFPPVELSPASPETPFTHLRARGNHHPQAATRKITLACSPITPTRSKETR